jgi:hypothetical protein
MSLIGFIARCKNFVLVLNGRRLMVNYKIVNTGKIVNVGGGFGEISGDILETKTDQIVVKGMRMSKAKEMVRHLNFGGGFDGSTPAFFLAEREKTLELTEELV